MTTEPPAPPGAPAPRVTPAGRLGQGELRRQVAAHLAASPAAAHTPVTIARALNRSAGATGNALATLAARGEAERVPGKPSAGRSPSSAGPPSRRPRNPKPANGTSPSTLRPPR
jgi:nitric oxide reductase NorQ protein